MWREGSIKKGERGVAYYRPEVHDVLVYDTAMDLLGLKAGTKGEKTLYREVLGGMLFGNSNYFAERFELSLDPLRERGPEVLACEDVPGMNSATLVEIRRFLGGEAKERQINQATDLFKASGLREARSAPGRHRSSGAECVDAWQRLAPTSRFQRTTCCGRDCQTRCNRNDSRPSGPWSSRAAWISQRKFADQHS